MAEFLRFDGVTKTFPGVKALQDVTFGVADNRVHALMGENGAGKSTLLKILSGAYQPTAGSLSIQGEPQAFRKTHDALAAGVSVIYQELHLVPELSVEENIFLGQLPERHGFLDKARLRARAREQLDFVGETFRPSTKVRDLPLAKRQMVEIAKALTRGARVIAFDEPTSSLSDREVRQLFSIIAKLRAAGRAILYVSHRMREIFEVCDAVTVLRDGRHVETFPDVRQITPGRLVERMVGRDIADVYNYRARPHGETALRVNGLLGPGLTKPVSFSVARGEVLGIFGLVGAGRTELLRLLAGAELATAGAIEVAGEPVTFRQPRDAIRRGVVLCPEDRKHEGIVPLMSVGENVNLSVRQLRSRFGLLNPAWERDNARARVDQLRVRTPNLRQPIGLLSGGNQQKVIFGRWLSGEVRVILLDEPTRGIDVGSKSEIYDIISNLAAQGVAVIVVSSELPEVIGIADRVLVMRLGELTGELPRAESKENALLAMALPPS